MVFRGEPLTEPLTPPPAPQSQTRQRRKYESIERFEAKCGIVRADDSALRKKAFELSKAGKSKAEIAQALGVSGSAVRGWLEVAYRMEADAEILANPDEFAKIVLGHCKALAYGRFRHLHHKREDRDEFAHTIFTTAWKRSQKYKVGRKSLNQYTYLSAYYAGVDYIRIMSGVEAGRIRAKGQHMDALAGARKHSQKALGYLVASNYGNMSLAMKEIDARLDGEAPEEIQGDTQHEDKVWKNRFSVVKGKGKARHSE